MSLLNLWIGVSHQFWEILNLYASFSFISSWRGSVRTLYCILHNSYILLCISFSFSQYCILYKVFCPTFQFIISPLYCHYVTNMIIEFLFQLPSSFNFSLVLFRIWGITFYSLLLVIFNIVIYFHKHIGILFLNLGLIAEVCMGLFLLSCFAGSYSLDAWLSLENRLAIVLKLFMGVLQNLLRVCPSSIFRAFILVLPSTWEQ